MRQNQAVTERLKAAVGLDSLWQEGAEMRRLTPRGLSIQLVRMAIASMRAAPFTALMTLLTMVFSLFVFSFFLLLVENLNQALAGTQGEVTMSVFLRDSATDSDRTELERLMSDSAIVRKQDYLNKDQALSKFREAVGADSPLLEGIKEINPLPASYELTFRSLDDIENQIQQLAGVLKGRPAVEHVEYSQGIMSAIVTLIHSAERYGTFAIGVMLILSGFIITIAIRLGLHAHRHEIEIMYLVGATRTFIRSPYMVEGFVQGLCGAILSLLVLSAVMIPLRKQMAGAQIVDLALGEISFLSISSQLLVVALGIGVGVIGSYLAVRKHSSATVSESS
jgi:cell division transport system permease protein